MIYLKSINVWFLALFSTNGIKKDSPVSFTWHHMINTSIRINKKPLTANGAFDYFCTHSFQGTINYPDSYMNINCECECKGKRGTETVPFLRGVLFSLIISVGISVKFHRYANPVNNHVWWKTEHFCWWGAKTVPLGALKALSEDSSQIARLLPLAYSKASAFWKCPLQGFNATGIGRFPGKSIISLTNSQILGVLFRHPFFLSVCSDVRIWRITFYM